MPGGATLSMTAPYFAGDSTLEISVICNTQLGASLGLTSAQSTIHIPSRGSLDCPCTGGRVNYVLPDAPANLPPPELPPPGLLVTGLYKPPNPLPDAPLPILILPQTQIGTITLDAKGRTDWDAASGAPVAIVATWRGAPAGLDGTSGLPSSRRLQQALPAPVFTFNVFIVSGCDDTGVGRCSAALLGTVIGGPIVTINLPPLDAGFPSSNTTLMIQVNAQAPVDATAATMTIPGSAMGTLFIPSTGSLGLCDCSGGAFAAAPPPLLGSTLAESQLRLNAAAAFQVGNTLPSVSFTPTPSQSPTVSLSHTPSPSGLIIQVKLPPAEPLKKGTPSSSSSDTNLPAIIGGTAAGCLLFFGIAIFIALRRSSATAATNAAAPVASRSIDAPILSDLSSGAPLAPPSSHPSASVVADRIDLSSPVGLRKV